MAKQTKGTRKQPAAKATEPAPRKPGRPKGSGKTPRKPDEKLRDQVQVSSYYLEGISQRKIADLLTEERKLIEGIEPNLCPKVRAYEVTPHMVVQDLGDIRKAWARACAENFDAVRAEQLARIDKIEHEAWEGWRRSIGTTIKRKRIAKPVDDGKGNKKYQAESVIDQEETKAGDPRFLATCMSCIERRCKLLGLDAITDLTATEMQQLINAELRRLNEAERETKLVRRQSKEQLSSEALQ